MVETGIRVGIVKPVTDHIISVILLMQKFGSILYFLISFTSYGQREQIKKIVWHNSELQSFVSSAKGLRSIEFEKKGHSDLDIKPDTSFLQVNRIVYDNWYSTVYSGHKYLFEKQFGVFPAHQLLKKLDSLYTRDCYSDWFEGKIFSDHIDIKITTTCPGKNNDDENFIFEKIDNSPGYFGGPSTFQQFVQSRLACTDYKSFIQGDSALFFTVLIKKDSMSHRVTSVDSANSPLRQIIQAALNNTHGWKPYNNGMNLSAYLGVFIYIRKDGSIEADYFR